MLAFLTEIKGYIMMFLLIALVIFACCFKHVLTQRDTARAELAQLQVEVSTQNAAIAKATAEYKAQLLRMQNADAAIVKQNAIYDAKSNTIAIAKVGKTCESAMQYGASIGPQLYNGWMNPKN